MRPSIPLLLLLALASCDEKSSDGSHDHGHDQGSAAHDHETTPRHDAAAKVAAPVAGPYRMSLTPAAPPAPGAELALTVEVRDAAGARVTAFDTVHEHPLHLIVVSPDLSFFAHLHPEPQPDGTLRVAATLPHPAGYVAFGDFRPTGAAPGIARATLEVPGEVPKAKPLDAKRLPARGSFDGFDVRLRSKAPLVAGADAVLEVEVYDKDVAVTDLQNVLGARGHCVLISEDTAQFVHTHPLGGSGSKVAFHATPPAPGRYKLWVEMRPAGKPVRASFVVEVLAEGPAAEEPHDHGGDHGHDHGAGHGH